jgi:hypothetical protein
MGVKSLDPVMLSRCIDDPVMMQGHRNNSVELGWDPILYARSGGKGPPLNREGFIGVVARGNGNPPGILRARIHTPKNRSTYGSGGMDDSSLETVGIYDRGSDSPLNDKPTQRRVTWDAGISDRKGCSVYGTDGIFKDTINTISKMKLLSKLDSGANWLYGGLEGLGMKCSRKFTPCADHVCGREAVIDVVEENDLLDCDDCEQRLMMHEEVDQPIENNFAYRDDFFGTSRDAIMKEFNFDTSSRSKFSKSKIETGTGEIIGVTSTRQAPSSSIMRNYQRSRRRFFPSESPRSAAAVVQYRVKQLSLSPTARAQPGERLSKGQRHSQHYASKPIRSTLAPIDDSMRKNRTKISRCIISGLKMPIKLISNSITSNQKILINKRILTTSTDYQYKRGE